jgi:cobalt-zinc-cadmium efflux system outer membrane protein
MKKTISFIYLSFTLLIGVQKANAQPSRDETRLASGVELRLVSTTDIYETIDFAGYLNLVVQNNLGFLAAKFDVGIAEAMAHSERVFPDPELTVHFFENDEGNMFLGRGIGLELDYELELGRKRRSRIRLAKSEAEMARILLAAVLADLRAEAAIAFLESQKELRMLELKLESYEAMKQLHQFDSLRFRLGEIPEIEFLQTRLETAQLQNEVFEQEAVLKSAMAALNELAGRDPVLLLRPQSTLSKPGTREYLLGMLLEIALDNHVDLAAVMQQKQITRDELRLTRAERAIDLGLNFAYDLRAESGHRENFFSTVSVGVTIPLRFSNTNRGTIHAAQFAVDQAEVEYRAMELEIKRDISQAFFAYEGLQKQVIRFESGMLDDARRIFDGEMFSYKNGETSLLEVLIARRTYNEVSKEYIDALFEYASSAVELNRASGIWEVEF